MKMTAQLPEITNRDNVNADGMYRYVPSAPEIGGILVVRNRGGAVYKHLMQTDGKRLNYVNGVWAPVWDYSPDRLDGGSYSKPADVECIYCGTEYDRQNTTCPSCGAPKIGRQDA